MKADPAACVMQEFHVELNFIFNTTNSVAGDQTGRRWLHRFLPRLATHNVTKAVTMHTLVHFQNQYQQYTETVCRHAVG